MRKLERFATIVGDSRWWRFYSQRFFKHPRIRSRIANLICRFRPMAVIQEGERAAAGGSVLKNIGFFRLGQLLTATQCGELVEYFKQKPVFDPYRPSNATFIPLSAERPSGAHVAHHSQEDLLHAPYLLEIANDPQVLDVVSSFLGCKPTIGYMAVWWSYPTSAGPIQAENFHRDLDDWRFVKLFVYLTDVTSENGPHIYVNHSSTRPALLGARRFKDAEVEAEFSAGETETILSSAGNGFLEDTFGIHKGQPLKHGHRLLFQVVYTLGSIPYAPKRPPGMLRGQDQFDAWTNRVYLE